MANSKKRKNSSRQLTSFIILVIFVVVGYFAASYLRTGQLPWAGNSQAAASSNVNYGSLTDKMPTQSLASSVLTSQVRADLGNNVVYNGAGAFTVNGNKAQITTTQNTPYASEPPISQKQQLGTATALVDYSTYQEENRSKTSSDGKSNSETIAPPGWHQLKLKGSPYSYLYNRGHSLGYAIIGNLAGFDASESNPDNISTQTAWANQADGGVQGNGQNYYEGLVRDAIKQHETVKYEVKPIYIGNDLVPVGTEIEAQGLGNNLNFNVFVPNVEPGVAIDYATGNAKIVGN
jgi:DNA-entry nuclease